MGRWCQIIRRRAPRSGCACTSCLMARTYGLTSEMRAAVAAHGTFHGTFTLDVPTSPEPPLRTITPSRKRRIKLEG